MSSNRTVAKLIEGIIGEENDRRGREEEEREAVGAGSAGGKEAGKRRRKREAKEDEMIIHGPEIWLCSTARSLVGKEKGRKYK